MRFIKNMISTAVLIALFVPFFGFGIAMAQTNDDILDVNDPNSGKGVGINTQSNEDLSGCEKLLFELKMLDDSVEFSSNEVDDLWKEYDEIENSRRYNKLQRKYQNDTLSEKEQKELDAFELELEDIASRALSSFEEQEGYEAEWVQKMKPFTDQNCKARIDKMTPVKTHVETADYPGQIFDGEGLKAGAEKVRGNIKGVSNTQDLPRLVIGWIKFALEFLIVLAVIAIIYGGVLMITDFGDGGRKEQGQKIVQYVIIGLIVIMASYAIVNTVISQQLDL